MSSEKKFPGGPEVPARPPVPTPPGAHPKEEADEHPKAAAKSAHAPAHAPASKSAHPASHAPKAAHPAKAPEVVKIKLQGTAFVPQEVAVPLGTTVEWEWMEGPHSVVADDGSFNSGLHHEPFKFSHKFEIKGRVQYYCEMNGARNNQGMHGVINVG